jgi:hypothetical protein
VAETRRAGNIQRFFVTATLILISLPVFCQKGSQSKGNEDVRHQLAAIALWDAKDLPDYLSRVRKIEPLLPKMDAFHKYAAADLADRKKKYPKNTQLMKLANFIEDLNERDRFGLELLREEVRRASQMAALPAERQQQFFDAKILPLQLLERDVVEEEIQMALKAQREGVPLPSYATNSLRPRQQNGGTAQ